MKRVRFIIPCLACLAMCALFAKLPDTPDFFGLFSCKSCKTADPYLPLIGSGYFAFLIALFFLFPQFPSKHINRIGLLGAFLFAITLTYLNFPTWCRACLISHLCHILIWGIWLIAPVILKENKMSIAERVFLTFFAPISIIALFSCLNLTFLAYGFNTASLTSTNIKVGQTVANFEKQIAYLPGEHFVINFISPNCPYCKEQLPLLNSIATMKNDSNYQFINISSQLSPDLLESAPDMQWLEDRTRKLHEMFKISGFPTLFLLDRKGRVFEVITGLPENFQESLLANLHKEANLDEKI